MKSYSGRKKWIVEFYENRGPTGYRRFIHLENSEESAKATYEKYKNPNKNSPDGYLEALCYYEGPPKTRKNKYGRNCSPI